MNSNPNDPDSDDDAFAPVLTLINGAQQVQYVTQASADPALLDGREVCASSGFPCNFKTSPTLADTDGDSYTDYDEIIRLGSQFNPLIANLPQLESSLVGTAGLTVDIAYSDSTQQAQTKSVGLSKGESDTEQKYASTVRRTWDKYGQSVSTSAGSGPKGFSWSVTATASFEEGTATPTPMAGATAQPTRGPKPTTTRCRLRARPAGRSRAARSAWACRSRIRAGSSTILRTLPSRRCSACLRRTPSRPLARWCSQARSLGTEYRLHPVTPPESCR